MDEMILDFTERHGDGSRRRRRRGKNLSEGEKIKITRKLQQVGFSSHEINMWLKENIPIDSRVAQNLMHARRRLMRYFMEKGYNFREARSLAIQDRVDSTKDTNPQFTEKESEEYLWGILYVLGPDERKISGPRPPWMKGETITVS
jgi:hypothetical protein